MHSIIAFDLDGTLCPVGKGMLPEDIDLLKQLERTGYTIVICSGKPTYYLCGFMRQTGLRSPVLIGENGCTFQFGIDLPPVRNYIYPVDDDIPEIVSKITERLHNVCGDTIWLQPNEIMVTPFPKEESGFVKVQQVLDESEDLLKGFNIYRHHDCFDITPRGINKGEGLRFLAELTDSKRSEIIAVGDGVNDVEMFEYADIAISLNRRVDHKADLAFDTLHEAMLCLLELYKREHAQSESE